MATMTTQNGDYAGRCLSMLFVLTVLLGVGAVEQAFGQETGSVTGHLYCADTHTVCRFGSVTIQSVPAKKKDGAPPGDKHAYSSPTDMDGVFEIDGAAAGEYYILGRCAGYVTPYDVLVAETSGSVTGDNEGLKYALNLVTVAAGRTTSTSLTIQRGASISGTVLYDDGSPAENLPVKLLWRNAKQTWVRFANSANDSTTSVLGLDSVQTDDRGRFREAGLPPGTYSVMIGLREVTWKAKQITGSSEMDMRVTKGDGLKVYFGDKYRLRETLPIVLHDGEDRTGVDVTIPANGLHIVRGLVSAKADGSVVEKGTVQLLDPEDKAVVREADIANNGTFVFHYVVNGSYVVKVSGEDGGSKTGDFDPVTRNLLVEEDVLDLNFALNATAKH
ncbi:carboxypeptidase-like regulatory domain-containing protein [Tunturiibacter lichenicola]|uniref:carboxypeptidase-like regulatory domain-containing protein n=1 Tax=Tunturiibacter lichenicola TaxID=2051959 RepID=UPI003D9B1B08